MMIRAFLRWLTRKQPTHRCKVCGGINVQISYPAWFAPNKGFKLVEGDCAAEPKGKRK